MKTLQEKIEDHLIKEGLVKNLITVEKISTGIIEVINKHNQEMIESMEGE